MIAEASQVPNESLAETLASKYYTPDRKLKPDWQVFNSVNGALQKVGAITENTFVPNDVQIVYPGGVTAKPVDLPMTIQFTWATRDSLSISGGKEFLYVVVSLGGEVALINILHDPTILPNV
jgi:hypothetical protein